MADSLRARVTESPAVRGALAVVFCVLCALGVLETRLSALEYLATTRTITDEATVPTPTAMRLLSLGHREWAADILWTNALLYFGETMSQRQGQRYLQRYADTIEAVDPLFRGAYLWGATVSVYNAGRIREDSVRNAIRHLERGLQVFPDDGEMTEQLGFNYFFELPPLLDDPEQKAAMRRRGAEYMRRAAALGAGPQWMALAAATVLERAGMTDRAREELEALYLRTEDPHVREQIAQRLRDLEGAGAEQDPFLVEAQRLERERREAYPYVPPVLYLFIGPPVPGVATTTPAAPATHPGEGPDAGAGGAGD